ncbi:urease accessory protein UreF [Jiella marina]|uniref:urease accessory protein UreF n=1 Tax=Jiella sp. LLJ827 TaxID=2917712 RepID=UPI002100D1C8|nr:urease accessory UreF family protein [Jiella sp. LLJ827]MCQ0988050.1 urease accessory protein UreF [Jiella sp. LLJ827]
MNEDNAATILTALQHADSNFPSGSFAFSQGLEGLASLTGKRPGTDEITNFVREQIVHRWASSDRVALAHAYRAGDDLDRVAEIDEELDLSTFCETLREGSRRNGQALLATHVRFGTPGAASYRQRIDRDTATGTLPVVHALLWRRLGLAEEACVAMSGYGLVSSSLTAAVRLNFVGALTAQSMMPPLLSLVATYAGEPVAEDAEICGFNPFGEIAAMNQAGLALRLFSN